MKYTFFSILISVYPEVLSRVYLHVWVPECQQQGRFGPAKVLTIPGCCAERSDSVELQHNLFSVPASKIDFFVISIRIASVLLPND